LLLAGAPVRAQNPLAAAVSDDVVSVTSDFRGARVTIFGALPDRRGRGDVVIAVRGPAEEAAVLRKQRILGLWIAGDRVVFTASPVFFALLANRPLSEIADARTRARLGLDLAADLRTAGPLPAELDAGAYRAALVRLRQDEGLYMESDTLIKRLPGGLFKAAVHLPANAPVGAYVAQVYFFRDGRMIDSETAAVLVSTVGFEHFVRVMAREQPLLYGLAAVAIALGAGWLASLLFRRP
ncbi:MAG: TIGR02186 family protein, partial [Hyphomonadaceae bacterium]